MDSTCEGHSSGPDDVTSSTTDDDSVTEKKNPPLAFTEKRIDITQDFLAAASELELGELVMGENFTLHEAMSAIELMDPKMDGGCFRLRVHPTVEDVVAQGWLRGMPDDEVLATVDATFACLVSWMEGAFIAQTLHTNLLMTDPDVLSAACECQPEKEEKDRVAGRTMTALSHGLAHMAILVRHAIGSASVCEEEDFAMQFPVRVSSSLTFDETLDLIKAAEKTLITVGKQLDIAPIIQSNNDRVPVLNAVVDRLAWLRAALEAMQHMIIPRHNMYSKDDDGEPINFRPRLRQAAERLSTAVECATRFHDTVEMGKMAPVGQDGDFGWLTCFIPDLNRRYLPPAFPRKSEFLTRRHGLKQLEKFTRRLYDVATNVPHIVHDLSLIIQYLRSFCELESCALSRSVLQLVLLPNDERVLGETHLMDILKDTIKMQTGAPLMYPGSPSNKSEVVQELFDEFASDAVRVYLCLIQAFGHNSGRQRDKIGIIFDDFANLQLEAERVDQEATIVTGLYAQAHGGDTKGPPIGTHLASFMNIQSLRLIHWYFELGFRLELFAECEYASVWWYMREIVSKWTFSWVDNATKFIYAEYQSDLMKYQKENPKAVKTRTSKLIKMDEKFKKKLANLKNLYTQGEEVVYTGMHMFCVGLQASGKMRIPELLPGQSEKMRYDHRMASLQPFAHPYYVPFPNYKASSGIDVMVLQGATKCFNDAASCFKSAKDALSLHTGDARCLAQARIAGQNSIVCKILASGARPDAKVEFDFSDKGFPFAPTLKLT
ncbi:natc-1 [Pristionchus pacificus]|uniref:Protein MAK10 homolog n=1 Tax=Pristionchus pacificus TaxID=54126 RepID=A0A2A6C9Z5_PRIPA|nr:natc-1 [Pristionchus pacificus]|eukprot:PDM75035.1 natc-1 [Pristionchus pacificus]